MPSMPSQADAEIKVIHSGKGNIFNICVRLKTYVRRAYAYFLINYLRGEKTCQQTRILL